MSKLLNTGKIGYITEYLNKLKMLEPFKREHLGTGGDYRSVIVSGDIPSGVNIPGASFSEKLEKAVNAAALKVIDEHIPEVEQHLLDVIDQEKAKTKYK